MKPLDLFGVVIRTIGFVFIVNSLWHILVALMTAPVMAGSPGNEAGNYWPFPLYLLQLLALAFGAVCFFCGDYIAGLAYSKPSSSLDVTNTSGTALASK